MNRVGTEDPGCFDMFVDGAGVFGKVSRFQTKSFKRRFDYYRLGGDMVLTRSLEEDGGVKTERMESFSGKMRITGLEGIGLAGVPEPGREYPVVEFELEFKDGVLKGFKKI